MRIEDCAAYRADVRRVAASEHLPWEMLEGATVVVSGATGMIGSHLVDVLAARGNVRVVALGRSRERLVARFGHCAHVVPVTHLDELGRLSGPLYVVHLASNTHPRAYAEDPIGTIDCNVLLTRRMLEFAARVRSRRFVFASSVEVYGRNRGDVELFDESYCGYIDCNSLRAGYPESKRCGEALCQAYRHQRGVDFVIPRIARTYGPTLLSTDTKALSQFLFNALRGEDVVLKSEGRQYFSYLHVSDAVAGILTVMLKGSTGEAYNLAHLESDISLRELAFLVARQAGRSVVLDLPGEIERVGASTATVARMDGSRARALGWRPFYNIASGVASTFRIFKECGASGDPIPQNVQEFRR